MVARVMVARERGAHHIQAVVQVTAARVMVACSITVSRLMLVEPMVARGQAAHHTQTVAQATAAQATAALQAVAQAIPILAKPATLNTFVCSNQ